MKTLFLFLLTLPVLANAAGRVSEQRCGWLESPSPMNYSLVDEEVTWTLAAEGSHQAMGLELLPEMNLVSPDRDGVAACACLDMVLNVRNFTVTEVVGSYALPLNQCTLNRGLPDRNWQEPVAPAPPIEPVPPPVDPVPPVEPAPLAEIQVFLNYRGYNDYSTKYVSRFTQLVSADYLFPGSYPFPVGACYKGDPDQALRIFESMVVVMNEETGRGIGVNGMVYFDEGRSNKMALQIYGIQEDGNAFPWFDRIRECDRWSTAKERENRP